MDDIHKVSLYYTVLVVVVRCAASEITAEIFPISPETVSAFEEGSLILTWHTSLTSKNISWCLWQFAECPDQSKCSMDTAKDLIHYNNDDRKRLDLSSDQTGWEFTNQESPCNGGLRTSSAAGHAGMYRLRVEDKKGNVYETEAATVILYKKSELSLTWHFQDTKVDLRLEDADMHNNFELAEQDVEKDALYRCSLSLNDPFPSAAHINITKYSGKTANFRFEKCTATGGTLCKMEFMFGLEKDVVMVAEIDTGIQGHPVVRVTQPFNYDEVPRGGALAIVFAVLFALLFLVVMAYLVLLYMCWRGKEYPSDDISKVLMVDTGWKERDRHDDRAHEDGGDVETKLIEDKKPKTLQDDLSRVKQEKSKLEKKLQEQDKILLDKDMKVSDWQKHYTDMKKENTSLEGKLKAQQEAVDDLQRQKCGLNTDIKSATEQINRLKHEKSETAEKKKGVLGIGKVKIPKIKEMPEKVEVSPQDMEQKKDVKISARITGKPKPTVSWYKGTTELNKFTDAGRIMITAEGEIHTLTFKGPLMSKYVGIYECRAESDKGQASQHCSVTIGNKFMDSPAAQKGYAAGASDKDDDTRPNNSVTMVPDENNKESARDCSAHSSTSSDVFPVV